MLNTSVKVSGTLFKSKKLTKAILRESLDATASWGLNNLRNLSPVKTGALRSGWYSRYYGDKLQLDNPVTYTKYQEKRFKMVSQTQPQIEKRFIKNIEQRLGKLK